MTVLERTYNAYVQGDHDDDVVWSNLAYPLAAIGAQSLTAALTVALTGTALALASGAYHAVYSDYTQRLDTTAMMGYLSSVTGSLLYPWLGAVLAPIAYAVYWTMETDSQVHVPAWSAVDLNYGLSQRPRTAGDCPAARVLRVAHGGCRMGLCGV